MTKMWIKVRWEFQAIHHYPNAPDEVSFLRNHHRHIFKCSAKIEVFHDDRELEFFIVQKKLSDNINGINHSAMSCEQIAHSIICFLNSEVVYQRRIEVEVSEDGENSAVVEYFP